MIEDIKKYEITLTNLLGAMNDFVLAQPVVTQIARTI